MNIEKLARHLKEFTLDEIETIAECDCKNELEQLLNTNKIVFEQGVFKIAGDKPKLDYEIFIAPKNKKQNILVKDAIEYFLENYAKKHCAKRTYETYESIFRVNIIPYFRHQNLNDITNDDVKRFYKSCKNRNLGVRRLKNTLALLNQLVKHFQNLGVIERTCEFQIKRVTSRFRLHDIIFK